MFQLVPVPDYVHLLFESLAFFVGFQLYNRLKKNDFLSVSHRNVVLAGCITGAAIGSKVLVWLNDPVSFEKLIFTQPWVLLSGKSIVGAILGGLLGAEIAKKMIKIKVSTGDLYVYPLLSAICVGRIGCFLCGLQDQTFGIPTDLPWGVDFGDGVSRHPVQLYEILFLLVWMLVTKWRKAFAYRQGELFYFFLVGYLGFRLWAETLKPIPHAYWGLNAIQILSIGVLIYNWKVIGAALQCVFLRKMKNTLPAS
ncbi:MAG: prolipoprotein diacylglyceryl transferase [Cyanobacteria bacterium]|nr:prolipoprotein diacylglyceryl transferase [Cyanobacteriota bacterium]